MYQTFLRPYVSRHETEIDRQLLEWKARGWDLFAQYWQIGANMGHTAFHQGLEYLAAQSFRAKVNNGNPMSHQKKDGSEEMADAKRSSFESRQNSMSGKNKKWPPSPPPSPSLKRYTVETPKFRRVESRKLEDGETVMIEDDLSKDSLTQARSRLRRLNTGSDSPRTPRSPHPKDL